MRLRNRPVRAGMRVRFPCFRNCLDEEVEDAGADGRPLLAAGAARLAPAEAGGAGPGPREGKAAPAALSLVAAACAAVLAGLPAAAEEPDLAHGAKVWNKCRACHTLEEGGKHRVGPNLAGMFGRPAAALPDYNYSEALRRSGLVWEEATLDRYLAATQEVVPGSKMYGGLAVARDRRDLIAWLKESTRR